MAVTNQFFQNPVDSFLCNSFGRQNGAAVFFFNSDDQIAAAHIINVVCKSADAMNNGIGVPVTLELDSG